MIDSMKTYIGTKIIKAIPMTRDTAEKHLGRNVGGDKHGDGYLVQYDDKFQSWSPKDVFEEAYRETNGMPFGLAIEALKKGKRVARAGWNSKGMWLRRVDPYAPHPDTIAGCTDGIVTNPYFRAADNNAQAEGTMLPWIGMKTADNKFVPWHASQDDMLAENWMILY